MEGQLNTGRNKPFPWKRFFIALLVSLLISAAALLLILSTGHIISSFWYYVLPIIFSAIGLIIPLFQWLLPIETSDSPIEVNLVLPHNGVQSSTTQDQYQQITSIWTVPYHRNPFFTGRENLLQHLHLNLISNQTTALTQTQAINGLGGVGKTQIALEYAYRHRQDYRFIFWVRAATIDTLTSDFVNMARLLHLPEQRKQDQHLIVEGVKQWLSTSHKWLLILDNADDLTIIYDFLPTEHTGHILLTTREQVVSKLAQSVEVESMDMEEGVLMLLRRANLLAPHGSLDQAPSEAKEQARAIVQAMGGLPLALDQAAAYIEETRCTLSAYLNTYKQRRADLLQQRGRQQHDHPASVVTTWSLSFQEVERLNPMAADVLRCCGFLAPDVIPEELFIEGAAELGSSLQALATDVVALDNIIQTLRRFSFLRRNPNNHTLSMHRLVQAVLVAGMSANQQRQWAERITKAVNKIFPNAIVDTWPQCERYLQQALVCYMLIDEHTLVFPEAARLLDAAGLYLKDHALYTHAEPLFKCALTIREQVLGPNHLDTTISLNNLARLYRNQGKYEQAEPLFKRALTIREQVLGPNHLDTTISLNNLAMLYSTQDKYEQAEPLLKRALTIREQVLGPNHLDTINCLYGLAGLYNSQGKYEQAEPLFKHVLTIREQKLGPDHPDTAHCLGHLAVNYYSQGKYKQAEPLFKHAITVYEQVFGPDHPDIARFLNTIAMIYYNQGKYKQAEQLFKRALTICERALGTNHPTTKSIRKNYIGLFRY